MSVVIDILTGFLNLILAVAMVHFGAAPEKKASKSQPEVERVERKKSDSQQTKAPAFWTAERR